MILKRLPLLLCLCVPACAWPDAPRTAPADPPPNTRPAPKKPDGIPVDTRDLFEAYEKNAGEADKEYRDKVLIIEGTVYAVDPNGSPPFVQIYGGVAGGGSYIRFHFETKDQVGDVKPGSKVSVKGRCVGALNNFVTLDGCTIQRSRNPN